MVLINVSRSSTQRGTESVPFNSIDTATAETAISADATSVIRRATDTLLMRLAKHEIDSALVASPVTNPEFESIVLFDEPFWLVHPQKHPLNEKKKISQADLDSTDLLLLAEGHCLAKQAMEVCRIQERGMQGDLADLRAASLETLLQMVAAGFGCTLRPALALNTASARDSNI